MARRFAIITEADARQLAEGSTVELERGGHVTPLARETLKDRHVTVVPEGATDPALPPDLAPRFPVNRLAIGSDHTGIALKSALADHLRASGRSVVDLGTSGNAPVDYSDIAAAVARAVARGEVDGGIVIDGAGLGSAIAANKVPGVRAAMCLSPTLARYAREHNGANVLTLGATLTSPDEAKAIVDMWMATPMTEARYLRRLLKIRWLEDQL
jgi:ribose 5-phosphate isomerase B